MRGFTTFSYIAAIVLAVVPLAPLRAQQLPPPLLPPAPATQATTEQAQDDQLPPRRRRGPPPANLDYESPEPIADIWMIDDPVTGFGNESLWFEPRPPHAERNNEAASPD